VLDTSNNHPTPARRKSILVTGGAGFLGSHLCEKLLAQGHHVICVDNLLTGQQRNIDHLRSNIRFTFIEHDVRAPIDLNVEEIYNLACPASPIHYQNDPIKTVQTCVLGAINMLELAAKQGAKILQASTSEIYGDPQVHPQPEHYWGNVNPVGVRSCYDEGKRCAETLFFDYARQEALNIRVARIFNTYGPRMKEDDGRVVSNFIAQALRNHPLTVFGDGSQTRSFCYVDDLVDGLISLMDAPNDVPAVMNIGNPSEIDVHSLANEIIRQCNSRSKLVNKPLPQDDPVRRKPDIQRARRYLNWEPATNLSQGLERTVAHFKNEMLKCEQAS